MFHFKNKTVNKKEVDYLKKMNKNNLYSLSQVFNYHLFDIPLNDLNNHVESSSKYQKLLEIFFVLFWTGIKRQRLFRHVFDTNFSNEYKLYHWTYLLKDVDDDKFKDMLFKQRLDIIKGLIDKHNYIDLASIYNLFYELFEYLIWLFHYNHLMDHVVMITNNIKKEYEKHVKLKIDNNQTLNKYERYIKDKYDRFIKYSYFKYDEQINEIKIGNYNDLLWFEYDKQNHKFTLTLKPLNNRLVRVINRSKNTTWIRNREFIIFKKKQPTPLNNENELLNKEELLYKVYNQKLNYENDFKKSLFTETLNLNQWLIKTMTLFNHILNLRKKSTNIDDYVVRHIWESKNHYLNHNDLVISDFDTYYQKILNVNEITQEEFEQSSFHNQLKYYTYGHYLFYAKTIYSLSIIPNFLFSNELFENIKTKHPVLNQVMNHFYSMDYQTNINLKTLNKIIKNKQLINKKYFKK